MSIQSGIIGPFDTSIAEFSGTVDPTIAPGVAATQPAMYVRTTGGVSTIYLKTGVADTAWTQLVTQQFSGNISASRFLGAADSASAPAFSWQTDDNTGLYSEAADTVSFTSGGARYMRVRSTNVDVLNTALQISGQFLFASAVAPTALTVSQNDYNPPGLAAANTIRQDATANVQLTGLQGGTMGRLLMLLNVSSANTITLVHDSASSAATNRFILPSSVNLVINANSAVILRYDGTNLRWRVVS